jgi:hypothetical protein
MSASMASGYGCKPGCLPACLLGILFFCLIFLPVGLSVFFFFLFVSLSDSLPVWNVSSYLLILLSARLLVECQALVLNEKCSLKFRWYLLEGKFVIWKIQQDTGCLVSRNEDSDWKTNVIVKFNTYSKWEFIE